MMDLPDRECRNGVCPRTACSGSRRKYSPVISGQLRATWIFPGGTPNDRSVWWKSRRRCAGQYGVASAPYLARGKRIESREVSEIHLGCRRIHRFAEGKDEWARGRSAISWRRGSDCWISLRKNWRKATPKEKRPTD